MKRYSFGSVDYKDYESSSGEFVLYSDALKLTLTEPVCGVCVGNKEYAKEINCICKGIGTQWAELEGIRECLADLEEVMQDHQRLVKELDIIINGENAAEQASLCDIVAQLKKEYKR